MSGSSRTPVQRLGWYTRRLRTMTPGEVCWRGARLLAERAPRDSLASASDARLLRSAEGGWERVLQDFRACVGRPVLLDRSLAREVAARHPDQVAALIEAAERIRAGHVAYFGYPAARLGSPIDWNHDPVRDVGRLRQPPPFIR